MTIRKKAFYGLMIALLILWTGFIFENSLENGETSMMKSLKVIEKVDVSMTETVESTKHYQYIFRKSAHFLEFLVLGFLWAAALSRRKYGKFLSLPICILTAFADEGIQHFTGRFSCFRDVCIDSLGSLTGIFLCFLLILAAVHLKKHRTAAMLS